MWSRPTDDNVLDAGIPRVVEVVLAAGGLVACAPLLAVVALLVRATSGRPVLYRQSRVGRGGAAFTLLKFRTMRVNHDVPHATAKGDPRVTAVGRWLRLLKVDELPELWHVVRGDMSLVGPRPEVPTYVDLSNLRWRKVLRARPGIVDPMSLRLRNEELLLARVNEDLEVFYRTVLQPYKLAGYVDYQRRRTIWSDIMVLLRTAYAVAAPATSPPPSLDEIRRATVLPADPTPRNAPPS